MMGTVVTPSPILDDLRQRFNGATGSVRVIAFLSPTCGPCHYGQGVVRGLFEAYPEEQLRGFIVWVPMLEADSAESATAEQANIHDSRIDHWFDANKSAARAWSAIMGLHGPAWDVYAVHGRDDQWTEDAAPSPRIWMHQLDFDPGVKAADRLDTQRLAREWLELLGREPSGADALARSLHERGVAVASRAPARARIAALEGLT